MLSTKYCELKTIISLFDRTPFHKNYFPQFSDRLVNSHWANDEQFIYHVAIVSRSPQSGRSSICSGAVVASGWILTSATCVLQSSQYEIRIASVNFYTGGRVVVSHVGYAHPEFNPVTQLNNIGLIQATGVGSSSSYRVLILPSNSNLVLYGRQSIVTGWGLTTNSEISPVLQYAYGSILNSYDRACKYNFENVTVDSARLCASFSGQRRCAGDTGSPLIVRANRTDYLVGVASFSPDSGRCDRSTSLFADFTPVVRAWINEITT